MSFSRGSLNLIILLILYQVTFDTRLSAQDRFYQLKLKMDSLSLLDTGLNQNIDISVSKLPIQEFLRTIAQANNLNLNIDPSLNIQVTNNFTNVIAKDVLLFLCHEYDLDLLIAGRIISVVKFKLPSKEPPRIEPRKLKVTFDTATDLLSIDLRGDSLLPVIREISRLSGVNILCTPDQNNKVISAYLADLPVAVALQNIALSNDLDLQNNNNILFLQKKDNLGKSKENAKNKEKEGADAKPEISITEDGRISLDVNNYDLSDIINTVLRRLKINYFILNELKGKITIKIENITYEDFLKAILKGSSINIENINGIQIIGESSNDGLRITRAIRLQNRPITDLVKAIPEKLKKNSTIQEFPDLNCLIVNGPTQIVEELDSYIQEIDKIVPLVLIEVIIIENNSSFSVSTGISAGLGTQKAVTSGSLFPEFQYQMNSTSVNNLINSFNGFGWFNLGKVTPNFYLNVKALEDEGLIKIRSTPKLATLNGHEAKLKIGKTEYYLEESSQIFANQTTTQTQTKQFKAVTADFTMSINPIVSGNEQVTLEIQVTQSDFTGTRLSLDAPPDQVTRSFSSLVRINNGETILLGGLEEKSDNNVGSGLPFLCRIPVIKWIFSNRTKSNKNNRLNIFIKPTIIY